MINMLPGDYVDTIRHSKNNEYVLRWMGASLVATIVLIVILASGWLYLNHEVKALSSQIAAGKNDLVSQNLEGVKKDASKISNDIKTINQVLGKEIRFSRLIQSIGQVMPPGTVLEGLTLTKADGSIDLTASAKDYKSGAQIALNLSDKQNGIFSRADIISLTCTSADTEYKCSVVLKALFSKESQAKFLNIPTSGSAS